MSSSETSPGRHRLAAPAPRSAERGRHTAAPSRGPSLVPRSMTVVAATVGAVFALGVDRRLDPQSDAPAPRPHPDAPAAAFQPVIPAQDDGRPARLSAVPAGVTGHTIAGAHATGSAALGYAGPADRALGAVPAVRG